MRRFLSGVVVISAVAVSVVLASFATDDGNDDEAALDTEIVESYMPLTDLHKVVAAAREVH